MATRAEVEIRQADFSLEEEYRALLAGAEGVGACVLFSGLVRDTGAAGSLQALELEHYPGMSESSIADIIAEARTRWTIARVRVIHRVGRLEPAAQIVLVGVTSAHRADAFAACSFIMDYLKTRAPFWKKEIGARGEHWVEHRACDGEAAARWAKN
ncbi:MAG: molybdopterin synthase catalytic subunit MoaE [Gammaproteobacteria bacterium]|jgi:molybdopterin synthase catalytic subunit|nr:molybdopterin synthase catalytic subunit MoaE [Gammaproteobacteria bacterium]MBP6050964.1 molybdopterin synthase catalytic subunit MoaE [Pseudomonadales bacterium]MBK6582471.1 molybdopterin synthase catalytic subunit MoaE [Gammaproteobacteria bacterium]MBK7169617.1 molybdopterin synthase catalytic subunit MoaE [Gammaproteobacteria bacterium]MBK7521262.1 molybdopterin synthase catalytic subunit MoaE [Gammaproteobacteria bacterium]